MKRFAALSLLFLLAACSTTPPVLSASNYRAGVLSCDPSHGDCVRNNPKYSYPKDFQSGAFAAPANPIIMGQP